MNEHSTDGDLGGVGALLDERLEADVVSWSGHLSAAMARWLILVGEHDARGLWERWECVSMVAWLSWHCGIDTVTAREHVRVARGLRTMPVVRAAFVAGSLSYSKVRALTRIVTPATEADLVRVAGETTAGQFARLTRGVLRVKRTLHPPSAAGQDQRRGLHAVTDDDGSLLLRVRLPADQGAAVMSAIRAVSAGHHAEQLADALVDLVTGRVAPDDQATLLVSIDATDLAATDGVAELPGGATVDSEVARRLGCDAGIIAAWRDRHGNPLRLGRRRRLVSPLLRRALERRDGHQCQFPGCTNRRNLHAHHVRHWVHGGRTDLTNLVLLCPVHHRAVHERGWRIVIEPDGRFSFHPPDRAMTIAAEAPDPERIDGLSPEPPPPGWYGQPWDLHTTIEVLLWQEDRWHHAQPIRADQPELVPTT
jgi:hypothetical protein